MPSMLRRLWILDTVLCTAQDMHVRTPAAQVLRFDRNSLGGLVTDGKHHVKVKFNEGVVQRHAEKGIPLEKALGGIITIRKYSLCLNINLGTKVAEFFFNIDDYVYHGGEGGILTCSVVDVHTEELVQSKMYSVLQDQGILQGQEVVGSEQSSNMSITLVEGLGVQHSLDEDVEETMWSQDLGSTQASTQDTEEVPSQSESDDAFVVSATQQEEVHKLLHGSDVVASPSLPVTTAATPTDAEEKVGEAIVLDSDCVKDSIVHGAPSESGGPEVVGASEGLQGAPQQAHESDDVTCVVEGGAEGSQSMPPAKKLRKDSDADSNREQVEVSEQGEEEEEHGTADEFFISATQVTALWGMKSDECNVLEAEEEGGGLTQQDSEWVGFSASLESVPLCAQEEEGRDVQFIEDSPCSAPLVIDLLKDSVSPDHDHCPGMLHGDDESLAAKVTLVSDAEGDGEGHGESASQLTVQESTSPVQDNREDGAVGAAGEVESVQEGHAEKDSGPLQTGEISTSAVQGKAGVWNEERRNTEEEEEVAVAEKGDADDEMQVEAAMDVEESSGRECTENDSDFHTAPSDAEVSSPLSNQILHLPSKSSVAPGNKGVLQTITTNTPVVVVDLVSEDTTPKTSEGLSDISHVSDSLKSSAAPGQTGTRTMDSSQEAQDKFTIIVPERSEPSASSVSVAEQDAAESSPVHTQPSQTCTASSSSSFTLLTPDISLPAYQMPSCSSNSSLLTSTAPITSATESPTQKQKELLSKIMTYWRRRHLESPVSSDILCEFTASRDLQVPPSNPKRQRGRPREHH